MALRSTIASASQSRERLKALAQCRKASSTVTRIATFGSLPFTAAFRSTSGSRTIVARPFTRRESSNPGIMKRMPTFGFSMMLLMVSRRLLPGRSGMMMVLSSSTWTKPAGSPRGDTSALPFLSAVPMQRNGDSSMKRRQCLSSCASCLRTAPSPGWPMTSRNADSLGTAQTSAPSSMIYSRIPYYFDRSSTAISSRHSRLPRPLCASAISSPASMRFTTSQAAADRVTDFSRCWVKAS